MVVATCKDPQTERSRRRAEPTAERPMVEAVVLELQFTQFRGRLRARGLQRLVGAAFIVDWREIPGAE